MNRAPYPLNENAAGKSGVSAATKLHELNAIATEAKRKRFENLRAQFAIFGHAFYETTSANGQTMFIATRYGLCRELESLDAAEKFFVQIGGAR